MSSSVFAPTAFGRSIEPMSLARLFFGLHGRVGRADWWLYGVLALGGLSILFTALLRVAGFPAALTESVVNLLLLWPFIAVSAKRWHDRGKSARWLLVLLLPIIGWLWVLIENGLLRGQAQANRFGPAP